MLNLNKKLYSISSEIIKLMDNAQKFEKNYISKQDKIILNNFFKNFYLMKPTDNKITYINNNDKKRMFYDLMGNDDTKIRTLNLLENIFEFLIRGGETSLLVKLIYIPYRYQWYFDSEWVGKNWLFKQVLSENNPKILKKYISTLTRWDIKIMLTLGYELSKDKENELPIVKIAAEDILNENSKNMLQDEFISFLRALYLEKILYIDRENTLFNRMGGPKSPIMNNIIKFILPSGINSKITNQVIRKFNEECCKILRKNFEKNHNDNFNYNHQHKKIKLVESSNLSESRKMNNTQKKSDNIVYDLDNQMEIEKPAEINFSPNIYKNNKKKNSKTSKNKK